MLIRGLPNEQTTVQGRDRSTIDGRSVSIQDFPAQALSCVKVYTATTADKLKGGRRPDRRRPAPSVLLQGLRTRVRRAQCLQHGIVETGPDRQLADQRPLADRDWRDRRAGECVFHADTLSQLDRLSGFPGQCPRCAADPARIGRVRLHLLAAYQAVLRSRHAPASFGQRAKQTVRAQQYRHSSNHLARRPSRAHRERADIFLAVSSEYGRFPYAIARVRKTVGIFAFGTSMGMSSICLPAVLRGNSEGIRSAANWRRARLRARAPITRRPVWPTCR